MRRSDGLSFLATVRTCRANSGCSRKRGISERRKRDSSLSVSAAINRAGCLCSDESLLFPPRIKLTSNARSAFVSWSPVIGAPETPRDCRVRLMYELYPTNLDVNFDLSIRPYRITENLLVAFGEGVTSLAPDLLIKSCVPWLICSLGTNHARCGAVQMTHII
jgi:hypothetical protein